MQGRLSLPAGGEITRQLPPKAASYHKYSLDQKGLVRHFFYPQLDIIKNLTWLNGHFALLRDQM